MVIEDGQSAVETKEASTDESSQSYADLLRGEGSTPKDTPSGENQVTQSQESGEPSTQQKVVEAIELAIGEKKFKGNPELFSKVLEIATALGDDSLPALSNAEKLAELKKGYDKKFTQNSQETSQFRKSLETNFGRIPQPQEFEALGKLYKSYLSNENVQKVVDCILQGQDPAQLFQGTPSAQPGEKSATGQDPILLEKISKLEKQISDFERGFQSREEAANRQKIEQTWNSWVEKQEKAGNLITPEVDQALAPFVDALARVHPDWDDHKILDEAYRHATIGEVEKKITNQVLSGADKAKTQVPPKMIPKVGQKPDSQKSYGDIIREANVA